MYNSSIAPVIHTLMHSGVFRGGAEFQPKRMKRETTENNEKNKQEILTA